LQSLSLGGPEVRANIPIRNCDYKVTQPELVYELRSPVSRTIQLSDPHKIYAVPNYQAEQAIIAIHVDNLELLSAIRLAEERDQTQRDAEARSKLVLQRLAKLTRRKKKL
jgi:predicted DNA-binding protein (UPF0251 family)